ncbi:hypothetical protein PFFCH_03241 [Plasmodium falciparum FCH/4]|uniref:U2A'/phosphoprotein 32 family A C-terminal domain-containing protein n=1 Tax=Plasmodium falciparum FCH/4 TaxID=1036724 RepID=A0A024VM23_PLAFA|nr:hypothetical protein PFFCH_03241 [Plasmodium falciparum FCH/4]
MRITIDMINEAEQSRNPVLENTISLRGNKISVIENLSITKDYFECIDLSDNEIIKLNNIPYLKKLKTLILCNNKIARIDADIFDNLPNLNSLVLTNNKVTNIYLYDHIYILLSHFFFFPFCNIKKYIF